MINKNSQTAGRIPVRFVDEEPEPPLVAATPGQGEDADDLSPDEIGRASMYEDATEVRRRVDRGEEQDSTEGRKRADDRDTAGGPPHAELPENRDDRDTTRRATSNNPTPVPASLENPARAVREAGVGGTSLSMQAEVLAAQAELGMVESELKKLTAEHHELQDALARRQADFDNYRKRVERERAETYNRAVGEVVNQLLPVVDNLRRAIDTESSVEAQESEEFRHFLHGVELINKQLNGVFESLGLQAVATVGQRFDPHVHEAIAIEPSDDYPPDTVVQEVVRGYRLGDRLLRPALVKVSTS